MFGKLSRYRKVPDVTAPDARGRLRAAKDTRPLPEVAGTFLHTVTSGDRLDQLAFTYYGEPTRYWHICDANPDFLSPLELLGQDPVSVTRFPLTVPVSGPPWAALLAALSGVVGVLDAAAEEDVTLVPERRTVDGQQVTVTAERYAYAVRITHNTVTAGPQQLAAVIAGTGCTPGPPEETGRLGRPIVIPAPVSG